MSVKLVKQPRRKTYDVRIWLKKYQKIHWVNTYCTNERDAKKVLARYVKADIEHGLGLRETQLPTSPPPSLGEAVDEYLEKVDKSKDMLAETYKLHKSVMNTFVDVMGRSVMIDQLGVDEKQVTAEASFIDDLGADSLDTVELVMAFEEEFDIEIPDDEAEKIATVQDATNYINSRTN